LLTLVGISPASHADAPPLRALVVTIVDQDGFLEWLVADAVAAGTVPPLALTTSHVRDLPARLEEGQWDLVIAHAHARPAQRLAARGVLGDGTPVFANPRTIIGPADDPAGLRGASDFDAALARLFAHGGCWVRHEHAGLAALQPRPGDADGRCVLAADEPGPLAALAAARTHGAYTVWGYHPFMRTARDGLAAVVIGDPQLLATLDAWTVTASPRRAEARAVIGLLSAPATQARLAEFRLDDDSANQAWWPAAAALDAASSPP
jgi:tungstate transport system substrate-binding protein